MDYRLVDDIEHFMAHEGLADKYDHIVLAGASLGATNTKFPAWRKTFWEHLQVAIDLHHIHKVMIMDHRDCGAYKAILGEASVKTPELEHKAHAAHLRNLFHQIKAHHPRLEVELLLMNLDGSVEKIADGKAYRNPLPR
jgi:carbonic anhydrase